MAPRQVPKATERSLDRRLDSCSMGVDARVEACFDLVGNRKTAQHARRLPGGKPIRQACFPRSYHGGIPDPIETACELAEHYFEQPLAVPVFPISWNQRGLVRLFISFLQTMGQGFWSFSVGFGYSQRG